MMDMRANQPVIDHGADSSFHPRAEAESAALHSLQPAEENIAPGMAQVTAGDINIHRNAI